MANSMHTPFSWCLSVVVLVTFSHWVETLLQISAGFWGNTLQQGAAFFIISCILSDAILASR